MKLKILKESETPKNCTRRAKISHEEGYHDWVRNEWDHVFAMWSNHRRYSSDYTWDSTLKKRVYVDSPFVEELDDDGFVKNDMKPRDGLIIIPVDIYEHSGIAWSIRGEGGPCFSCPFDSTSHCDEAPFYLWVDEDRWKRFMGDGWEWVDGKPSAKLLEKAMDIARGEVKEMNLCEDGEYWGWHEEELHRDHTVVTSHNAATGTTSTSEHDSESWDETDGCGGYLTDKPAEDVDFPLGIPVVTDYEWIEGKTFDQECWALGDDITGEFIKFKHPNGFTTVKDPVDASLHCKRFLTDNLKGFENDLGRALTVVDVTERVWAHFPECIAKEDK